MLLRCCFNWKVWLGAVAVAIGVLVFARSAAGAAVPIVIGLACPLSMVVMMWGMRSGSDVTVDRHAGLRSRIAALEAELREAPDSLTPPAPESQPSA